MNPAFKIDLHMHSTASDGSLAPAALARACKELGLTHAALTDHDTAAGVGEFLCEAKRVGLCAVSGMEFNVAYHDELHILAYGFNPQHPVLLAALRELAAQRTERVHDMVAQLNRKGYSVDIARVAELAHCGTLGRPHIARALFEAGYAPSVEAAFNAFLQPGKPGFLPRKKIASDRAIALARQAGGTVVLAHPGQVICSDLPALIARLVREGLQGIEAFYPTHSDEQTAAYCALAEKFNLLVTAGSDYHGSMRAGTHIGGEARQNAQLLRGVQAVFARAVQAGHV